VKVFTCQRHGLHAKLTAESAFRAQQPSRDIQHQRRRVLSLERERQSRIVESSFSAR
jgi:hypothetical protein